ncbi:hypothetical protein Unana1_02941 [Umbelopsis nana]
MAEIIQKAFRNVVEDTTDSALEQIPLYFSSKYIQHVDDKTIDYQHFIDHMKAQKKAVASVKITFERLIEAGSQIGSVHVAHAIKKNGTTVRIRVIALFKIVDGKIEQCDEVTQMLQGSEPSDADLGSRT